MFRFYVLKSSRPNYEFPKTFCVHRSVHGLQVLGTNLYWSPRRQLFINRTLERWNEGMFLQIIIIHGDSSSFNNRGHPVWDLVSCTLFQTDQWGIVLYSIIYIAPLNSHRQTEALLVRLAPRKETSFKK